MTVTKKINVLSLFDGMSCGQLALNRAGIKYNNYYSCEINKHAIKVTQKNFPDTIQLGSVTELKFGGLPKIDLLFAGSPCQGFSNSGKYTGFAHEESKLYFEFLRVLKEFKPKYFLLENIKMKKEWVDIISKGVKVEPIEINSSRVSAQNRKRLYWTNIPGIKQPENKNILLKDILENFDFKYKYFLTKWKENKPIDFKNDKYKTLLGARNGNKIGNGEYYVWRNLTSVERERLQNVPDNYTDYVSKTRRNEMIGNGWTVDVIAHILKNMK